MHGFQPSKGEWEGNKLDIYSNFNKSLALMLNEKDSKDYILWFYLLSIHILDLSWAWWYTTLRTQRQISSSWGHLVYTSSSRTASAWETLSQKAKIQLGVLTHAFNPSTFEVELGGPPWVHVSLVYIGCSWTARVMYAWDLVSKQNKWWNKQTRLGEF